MAERLLDYLNPPKGKTLDWPTDIAENDTAYLRRYIKWKYPEAFKPEDLPLATHEQLTEVLEAKGYTWGEPVRGFDSKV